MWGENVSVNGDVEYLRDIRDTSVSRVGFSRDINQIHRLTYSAEDNPSSDAVDKAFSSRRGPSYLLTNERGYLISEEIRTHVT